MTQHISDVDTWGGPDRNYFLFVALSIVLGFLGVDHFYLRSFATGTQKLITNVFTLGLWYWWDLLQILTDGEKIRKDGLSSPLDWVQGIGRGVFAGPPSAEKCDKATTGGGSSGSAKKSYLIYAFLAIFFGWLGADKFYLGYGWQGIAKVLSCFNIFLFLFGWMWVLWDGFKAFFMTDSILKDGITAPLPYSMLFTQKIDGDVFKVQPSAAGAETTSGGMSDMIGNMFGVPAIPTVPWREVYRELVAPVITPQLIKTVREASAATQAASAAVSTAANTAVNMVNTAVNAANTATAAVPNRMTGGGVSTSSSGPGPVIAGALTAVVLAGGLKGFYDFISKQYG
jgi:TM2 domain-containing membrane protein YozV